MKEPVRRTKHPYLVGVAIACVVGAYFHLVSKEEKFPEPGPNLEYDISELLEIDEVETAFEETGQIVPDFDQAKALETDADGNLYISGENTIAVFDSTGKETSRIDIDGTPTCLELTPDNKLLVGLGDRVLVLGPDRSPLATWSDLSERTHISAMAASEENVFLADGGSRLVLRVDYEGNVLDSFGKADEARDIPGLEAPSAHFDVAFDNEGNLWVVNPGKLGLERYRENGDIVTTWYRPDVTRLDSFSGCCNPMQIAFNSKGRLVTGEKGPVRIKIFEVTSGSFEELVVGSSAFHVPQSIGDMVVDASDRILVLDPRKKAVRIFEQTRTTLASKQAAK